MAQRRHWKGGFIRKGAKGEVYVIERWVGGIHYKISTRCRTKAGAMAQLAKFEAGPAHYSPGSAGPEALVPSLDLVREYSAWMRDTKKNSDQWIETTARFLAHWREDLEGKDLRALNLQRDLKAPLDKRKTSRRHRIEAIKAFCSWLRREKGLLSLAEDRTVDLAVPQVVAAKTKRRRAVRQNDVRLVLAKLEQGKRAHSNAMGERWLPRPPADTLATRDVMLLQAGTAWHISEVLRFSESGEIVRTAGHGPLAVLVTRHKSGELTRTPLVAEEHLAAAERIRARGTIPPRDTLADHLAWACAAVRAEQVKAGIKEADLVPDFRLGVMRHSVLTWAVEMGATPEQASQFAGHRSVRTSSKFYIDVAVPTVTVPVLRLVSG